MQKYVWCESVNKNLKYVIFLSVTLIPLRVKRVGEFMVIRHNKISPTRILSTLGFLSLCGQFYFSNRPTLGYSAATHLPETAQYLRPQFGDNSKFFIKMTHIKIKF